MPRQILEDIIQDFEPQKFTSFFRAKNRRFNPQQRELEQYNDENENFQNGQKIGEIEFNKVEKLIICVFEVKQPLSKRSGKKAQYELGRQILKTENVNSGIFIFYDSAGNFRFSLIYDIPFGPRRKWSNFRRFTYFVSQDQTNKTFLKQIGEGDFSSLENIKEAFSVEKVTKEFFRELSNWYFWAIKSSKFPKDAETAENNGREIAIIRLITRLIFIWFMKQKGLVPEYLFEENKIKEILKDLSDNQSTYYKAILQNLFFATLNTPKEKRGFRDKKDFHGANKDFMRHDIYRYEDCFKKPKEILGLFKDIPFLNGGLFECLDKIVEEAGKKRYVRIDGFSDRTDNPLKVPNFLFFSPERTIDLNREYGTKGKKYKVEGIINILNRYNFTIDENTPLDVDVALDPELLGRVFENLLANFNPETSTTARKATGSYYTPRPIVDYMVDESLKAYFKTKIKTKDIDKKLDELFSYSSDEHSFTNPERKDLVKAISEIKIIDPAVGSGAFPMGVLQRLVHLLSKLDPDNKIWRNLQKEKVLKQFEGVLDIKDKKAREEALKEIDNTFEQNTSGYGRKLYLIKNCIYGVDIQPIAIQIAKLRFFISLLVDMKEGEIEPLPNLETKFVCANTLLGLPVAQYKTAKMEKLIELEEKLFANRKKYFSSFSPKDKEDIKKEDLRLRQEILKEIQGYQKDKEAELENLQKEFRLSASKNLVEQEKKTLFETKKVLVDLNEEKRKEINQKIEAVKSEIEGVSKQLLDKFKKIASWEFYNTNKSADWFDPEWMLGVADGFDIVIGNPPYIQLQKNGGELANLYQNAGWQTFDRRGDIYCLFYEKGNQLLSNSGHLAYITSNKWMRAGYGEKLRKYLAKNTTPKILIDLGPGVFESATVDTNILLFQKGKQKAKCTACSVKENLTKAQISLKDYIEKNKIELDIGKFDSGAWVILSPIEQRIKEKIEKIGTPLKDWDIKINYGIKTGYNEAFIIDGKKKDELIAQDPKSAEIIKPILRGKDIGRYCAKFADKWLIATHNGYKKENGKKNKAININNYPAVKKWLDLHWEKILARQDQGNTPYNLRDCAYWQEFEKEKIVYSEIVRKPQFYFDSNSFYVEATSFLLTGKDIKFLIAILNSKPFTYFFKRFYAGGGLGDEGYRYKKAFLERVPIPNITKSKQKPFINLVNQILKITSQLDYDPNNPPAKQKELEVEIDRMVYKLYGLSEEEVKVVESKSKI